MQWRVLLVLLFTPGLLRADDLVIERAVLRLIEHADVPAAQAGRIDRLLVHEGETVAAGQRLVQLDDREAKLAVSRARLEFESARFLAADHSRINTARKAAEKQKQVSLEQRIDFDIAQSEALNDVAVRAAAKARDVADNEFQRAQRARESSKNSVSESTLDGLRLELEKATLAHEQAEFQLALLKLRLEARKAGMRTQALAVEEAELAIQEAESLRELAGLQADLKRRDVEAAEWNVSQRAAVSPIDGIVVELDRRSGEWVQPGDKVARVIQLNRLRAEGLLPLARVRGELIGQAALIEVITSTGERATREGRITFVSPDVDPINQEVRIWAEFENPDGTLLPGLRATIRIPSAATTVAAP